MDTPSPTDVSNPPAPRPRWLRIVAISFGVVVGLFLLLLAAAYLAGPPLTKRVFEENFANRFGRPISVGEVQVDPFRLGVAVRDLRIDDTTGGAPLADIGLVSLRLSLASIYSLAIVIDDYVVQRPKLSIVRLDQDRFNFSDVLDRLGAEESGADPIPIKVRNIRIEDGSLAYDDRVVGQKHLISEFFFRLPVFSNLPRDLAEPLEPSLSGKIDGSPLAIKARTKLLATSREADLTAELSDVELSRYVAFLPFRLPIVFAGGRAGVRVSAHGMRHDDGRAEVQGSGEVSITDVALDEEGGASLLRAPKSTITIADFRYPENRASVSAVIVDRPVAAIRRDADGKVNLEVIAQKMVDALATAPATGPKAESGTAAKAAPEAAAKATPDSAAKATPDSAAKSTPGKAAPSAASSAAAKAAMERATGRPPPAAAAGATAPAPSEPYLEVNEIRLTGGTVELLDRAVQPEFKAQLQDINLAFRGFKTTPRTPVEFEAALATDAGEKVAARGKGTILPVAVEGEAEVGPLRLARFAPYLGPQLAPALADGAVSSRTRFGFVEEGTAVDISGLDLKLDSLRVRDPATQRDIFRLPQFALGGVDIDLAKRSVKVATLEAQQGFLELVREKNGTFNIDRLIAEAGKLAARRPGESSPPGGRGGDNPAARPAAGARGDTAAKASSEPAWQIAVDKVRIAGFTGRLEDRMPPEKVVLVASPVTVSADGFSTAPRSRTAVAVQGTINKTGRIDVQGRVAHDPPAGDLRVAVSGLDFSPVQQYLVDYLNIAIRAGRLDAKGNLSFAVPAGKPPRLKYAGEARVVDFGSVTSANGEAFLDWKSLAAGGIKAEVNGEQGPVAVDIDSVTLSDFFSRLILFQDGRFNLQDILVDSGSETAGGTPVATHVAATPPHRAPSGSASAKTVLTSVGGAPEKAAPTAAADTNTAKEKKSAVGDVGIERPRNAPPIRIGRIAFERGRVNFSDFFIRPNYSAELDQVNGTVDGLSSAFDSRAKVLITGRYHNSSPVEIKGTINPLRGDLYLDIAADARDIELVPFTPYAQKYAGYGITKGKMSVTVKYLVDKRQLKAENRLFLDQLTFGEKVDSPEATKLPVLLAVSVLKNPKGEIDINLPISGSLDDPDFSVGELVVQAIVSLLTKVATAPFALIASLADGAGAELSWVGFAPGEAKLASGEESKIAAVAKALGDRPQLKLDIAGRSDREVDREGLKRHALERKLRARKQAELTKAGKGAPALDAIALEPGERERLLAQVYEAEVGPLPKTAPPPAPPPPSIADKLFGAFKPAPKPVPPPAPSAAAPSAEEMERALLERITVDNESIRRLSEQRAGEAKARLVAAGVAPERLFIVADVAVGEEAKGRSATRVDLALK